MKLLIISNNPDRPSFRQRIQVHLEYLSEKGISSTIEKLPSKMTERFKLYKKASDFDAVFLHKKKLNMFDAFVLRKYSRKIIYDFDDAVMFSTKRPEKYSRAHYKPFKRTVSLADAVIAGNSYLADKARAFNKNVVVIPTGLNISEYDLPAERNDQEIRLVWIGSKSTLPYLKEIRPTLEKIGLKYKNVVLRIICDDFFDLENMQVEKIPWSLNTQAKGLVESDIGLAPLCDNTFTRGKCGFKILQYSAAGLPTVTSPVGVNAQYVNNEKSGLIASTDSEWFEALSRLIEDKGLCQAMERDAKEFVKDFDLKPIGERIYNVINECVM